MYRVFAPALRSEKFFSDPEPGASGRTYSLPLASGPPAGAAIYWQWRPPARGPDRFTAFSDI